MGNLFLSAFNLNFKISDLLFIFKHKSDSRIIKSSQPSKFTTCLYCFTSTKTHRMEPCLSYLEVLARIIFHLGSSLNKGLLSVPSLVPFGYCMSFSEQELRSKPLFLNYNRFGGIRKGGPDIQELTFVSFISFKGQLQAC